MTNSMNRGFTLIETLFAILILTLAIAGPLTIAARGLNAALIAKDQTTAFYLAQDAIEYIRYARDSACLSAGATPCPASTWLSTVSACEGANGCYLDSSNNHPAAPTSCSAAGCPVLNYDPTTGLYTYALLGGSGTATAPTPFTRTIQIITPVGSGTTNPGEATASTTVSWMDVGGVPRSISVHEDIFNWQ